MFPFYRCGNEGSEEFNDRAGLQCRFTSTMKPFDKGHLPDSSTTSGLKTSPVFKLSCNQGARQKAQVLKACPLQSLRQRFSVKSDFISQIWQEGDNFVFHDLGQGSTPGIGWVEAREAAQILHPSQQRIIDFKMSTVLKLETLA